MHKHRLNNRKPVPRTRRQTLLAKVVRVLRLCFVSYVCVLQYNLTRQRSLSRQLFERLYTYDQRTGVINRCIIQFANIFLPAVKVEDLASHDQAHSSSPLLRWRATSNCCQPRGIIRVASRTRSAVSKKNGSSDKTVPTGLERHCILSQIIPYIRDALQFLSPISRPSDQNYRQLLYA